MTSVAALPSRNRHIELMKLALQISEQLKDLNKEELAIVLDTIEDLPAK